jgi:hypothetical protein
MAFCLSHKYNIDARKVQQKCNRIKCKHLRDASHRDRIQKQKFIAVDNKYFTRLEARYAGE